MRNWLHDLRTPVTALAGWVRMLGEVPGEATRIRATDAIERNAKLLSEVLAHRRPALTVSRQPRAGAEDAPDVDEK